MDPMFPLSPEGKPRILAVDDEPANLVLLGTVLADSYDLTVALSGEEGLERAHGDPAPELIVLDLVMPGIDGYETLQRLKADPATSGIPVIFLTARASEEDEKRGFDMGAVDYINKPLRPSTVRARIRTHLELKHKTDLLESLARHDALTGLLNKRGFQDLLVRDWHHAIRNELWISLVMIDIDHFKAYNDRYGHLEGDICLAAVARALITPLKRRSDAGIRFGGEEFILYLPGVGPEGALGVAEKARQAVLDLKLPAAETSVAPYVTISLGVASLRPTPGLAMDSLIASADQHLYQAKNAGRNCIRA